MEKIEINGLTLTEKSIETLKSLQEPHDSVSEKYIRTLDEAIDDLLSENVEMTEAAILGRIRTFRMLRQDLIALSTK